MLLILKIIKIFKKCYHSVVVVWQHMSSVPVMRTVRNVYFLVDVSDKTY
jgi:hypothetical protein